MVTFQPAHRATGLSAVLQVAVVQIAPLNVAFSTAPLSAAQWLLCVAMGSVVLWFAELRKWILRLMARRGGSR